MSPLWGGRFSAANDPLMARFNASLPFDWRLWEADIAGSIAWAGAICRAGLLTAAEHGQIVAGLTALRDEIAASSAPDAAENAWRVNAADEDIHSYIERRLTERIGPVAGKLHTGRSRNDQVATDVRLWLKWQIVGRGQGAGVRGQGTGDRGQGSGVRSQESAANFQSPTSNLQPPTSNFQLPTSNFQLPTSNFQLPTSNCQLPTSNIQHPTSNLQPPAFNLQPPASGLDGALAELIRADAGLHPRSTSPAGPLEPLAAEPRVGLAARSLATGRSAATGGRVAARRGRAGGLPLPH